MLTKAMLQYRLKAARVYPTFLTSSDAVGALDDVVLKCIGATQKEANLILKDACRFMGRAQNGMVKVLESLLEWEEPSPDASENRWRILEFAEKLRRDKVYPTLSDFHAEIEGKFSKAARPNLYSDVGPYAKVLAVKPIKTSSMDRYNLALVQTLVLQCNWFKITVPYCDLATLRALVRAAKFFQVLLNVRSKDKSGVSFFCEGPTQMFHQTQAYGMRLAKFLPCVLHLEDWQLEAEIPLKGRARLLKLDNSDGLRSHYRPLSGFVPEEFADLSRGISKELPQWQLSEGVELINLGQDEIVVPDVILKDPQGNRVYCEIFHKWHQGQLERRIETLTSRKHLALVLVAPKQLLNKLDKIVPEHLAARVVEYSSIPSVKKLAKAVKSASEFVV